MSLKISADISTIPDAADASPPSARLESRMSRSGLFKYVFSPLFRRIFDVSDVFGPFLAFHSNGVSLMIGHHFEFLEQEERWSTGIPQDGGVMNV